MLSLLQALRLLQISDLRHGSSVVPGIRSDTAPATHHGPSSGLRFGPRSERSHLERRYRLVLKAKSCSREQAKTQNRCKQKKHSITFVESENIEPPPVEEVRRPSSEPSLDKVV